jgi:tetratricopeptide (TPR) repeat protein
MPDFAYIDRFFKGELNKEELMEFEQKIKSDPVFAEEVAFYYSVMHAFKRQLAEEKKEHFRKIYNESKSRRSLVKPGLVRRLWPYAAAAAIVTGLIIGVYMYLQAPFLQYQANRYIKQNFEIQMGVQMSGTADSIDAAIQLYNENKLPGALQQFEKIIQYDSTAKPKRMAGIVSLRLGNYDKAIDYFTQLENLKLSSNPGKLYHALALIKRNRTGDKETVRELLQQVIDQDLEGKETAQKWMKSL